MPVDEAGFQCTIKSMIDQDLISSEFSFESSPYLSLSIRNLFSFFGCKFLLLIRDPKKVVQSHVNKGWYEKSFDQNNQDLALGWQKAKHPHHYFGRISPRGTYFNEWNNLSQVGKCAWYWKTLNSSIEEQFSEIPEDNWLIQKLEDLDFQAYQKITHFFGFKPSLGEEKFHQIVLRRPNATKTQIKEKVWNTKETEEYNHQVSEYAKKFGYETS